MKKVLFSTITIFACTYVTIQSLPKIGRYFLKKNENIDFDYDSFSFYPNQINFKGIKVKKEGKFDINIEEFTFALAYTLFFQKIVEVSNLKIHGIKGKFIDQPKDEKEKRSIIFINNIDVKDIDLDFLPEKGESISLQIDNINSTKRFNLDSSIYGIGIMGNVTGKADGNQFLIKSNESEGEWDIFCPISLMKKMDYKFSLGIGLLLENGHIKVSNKYLIGNEKVKMKWNFAISEMKNQEGLGEKVDSWMKYFNEIVSSKSWNLENSFDLKDLEEKGNDYFKKTLKEQSVQTVVPNFVGVAIEKFGEKYLQAKKDQESK